MNAEQIARERRGVVEMLQNGHIDLAVLLQPRVARKLKIRQEREYAKRDSRG
jgi:hypothetical protein